MKIGKKYKIGSDDLNITLSRKHLSKPKGNMPAEERWTVIGYYSKVTNALKDLVDFGVRETELKDLQTIVDKIDELTKLIERATKT